MRLSDLSPRSKLAGAVGILLLVPSILSYPHYVGTACFVFAGTLLLVMVVLAQPAFARFITSISPGPWPPNSARGWFGVAIFGFAVTGMVLVVVLSFLYAHTI